MRLTGHPQDAAQVTTEIRDQVDAGTLAAGERLPTVRALAAETGLAANTVAKAYRELERLGVVETRGRAGTFVAGAGVERAAREAAAAYAATVTALGLDADEALRLVAERLGQR